MTDSRQRGVRLSRLKLTAALRDAGLKTQAALAERIAELEGHSSIPKNLVSRAFREIAIQVESADRLARALGVPVHALFLASSDATLADGLGAATDEAAEQTQDPEVGPPQADPDMSAEPAAKPQPTAARSRWPLVAGLAVIALAAIVLLRPSQAPAPLAPDLAALRGIGASDATVAVSASGARVSEPLADALRDALAPDYRVASKTATLFLGAEGSNGAQATRQSLGADLLLELDAFQTGRRIGAAVYITAASVRRQIWAESIPARDLMTAMPAFARRVVGALDAALGRTDSPVAETPFPSAEALAFYLEGRDHLDMAPRELAIRRAQSSFQSALRVDANYALAQAGLCEALLEEYWMNDEIRAIRNAEEICTRAFELAPGDAQVLATRARLLQVSGKNDEALALYESILDASRDHPEALLGMAISSHQAYRATGEENHLGDARRAAERATAVDADNWKPPFRLGSILLDSGELDAAIAALRQSIQRREHEFGLANLGTLHTCAGNFDEAEAAFLRADEVAGTSHVDSEMLGQLYYFLERFDESVRYRKQAIASVASGRPDIHQMWGGLADALRQQGQIADAINAYTEALTIVERDIMSDNQTVSDEAARAYYYSVLATLPGSNVPAQILREVTGSLDELAQRQAYGSGFRYVALAFALNGRDEDAALWLQKAAAQCPGYLSYPDFASITYPVP